MTNQELSEKTDTLQNFGKVENNLNLKHLLDAGIKKYKEEDYDSALFYYDQVKYLLSDSNEIDKFSLNVYYGELFWKLDKYDTAIYFLHNGLKSAIKNHGLDHPKLISYYKILANIYRRKGEYQKAKHYDNKSLSIIESADSIDYQQKASLTFNMGNTYISLKEYNTALEYYFKALTLYNKSTNRTQKIKVYPNIARSYAGLSQIDSANKYFEFALGHIDEISYSNLITLYQNYGNFLMVYKKDLPGSYTYYSRAAQLIQDKFHSYHPRLKNIYVCIGDVYWRMNKMDSALYMYQQALKTIDTTLSLTEFADSPDFQLAADLESLNIIMRKIRVLEILLVYQEDPDLRDQYYEALLTNVDYYKDAFAALLARKILLADQISALKGDLKNMMDIGIEAAYKLYKQDHDTYYLEKALAWSETARSLILKTNFYSLYQSDSSMALLLEQAGKLKKRINALYFRMDELEKGPEMDSLNALIFQLNYRYDSLNQLISKQLPDFIQSSPMRQYDANELIREIPDSTLIVEYFLYRDRLHVFKMSGEGIEWHRIPFNDSLKNKVEAFIGLLKPENAHENQYRASYLENAYLLRKAIIPGEISQGINKIVFIPDGMLYYFPFEIMHTRESQTGAYRKMPYLLWDYNISYRYTLDTLEDKIKREKARILAVASEISNFYRDDGKLISPIAEARSEADTIVKLYRGRLYSPDSEKEFARMAEKYEVLHFATHGIIDNQDPMNSHLLLQKENNAAIKLSLAEICNLELKADMAVLSACETGKGDMLNGEGVLSLAWAFKYAGCPNVLMSLNLLDDQSAKKLMIRFYDYLEKGYLKDEALRKAKLDFLREMPPFKTHPAYWAGLISTGDQSKVLLEKNKGMGACIYWIALGAIILLGVIWLRKRV